MKIKVIAKQTLEVIRDDKGHKVCLEPCSCLELVNDNKTYIFDDEEMESEDLSWDYSKDCIYRDWYDDYHIVDLYEDDKVIRVFWEEVNG